jgi:hypothetical protein
VIQLRKFGLGLIVLCLAGCNEAPQNEASVVTGDYLGETPPGKTAKLFAPAVVSTGLNEDGGPVFTADGNEVFWRIGGAPFSVLCWMKREKGRWSEPMVAPFSGRHQDAGPAITPDGRRIYFASKRPLDGVGNASKFSTWTSEKVDGAWTEPVPAGAPIDHPDDYYTIVSVATDGMLVKQSRAAGGEGGWDLYYCERVDGGYLEQRLLPGDVNTEFDEYAPAIAPDASYLVFQSHSRPDTTGAIDLYVTFRCDDGTWSPGVNLGDAVNTVHVEKWPSITPDGRYLFFTSDRPVDVQYSQYSEERKNLGQVRALYEFYHQPKSQPGWGDVYWVDAVVVEELHPER